MIQITGGDGGARTLGLHVANVALSQLSYIPTDRLKGYFLTTYTRFPLLARNKKKEDEP